MATPHVTVTEVTEPTEPGPGAPLLVLGPSLGTACVQLWSAVLPRLAGRFRVLAWDLPGHGANRVVGVPYTIAELAGGVLAAVDRLAPGEPFRYAGVSVGGATGLQLLLDAPERVTSAAILASAPRLGDPVTWAERAATVRAEAGGTAAVVDGSRERWFAPGFARRRPEVAVPLLHSLLAVDAEGYAQTCEALGGFDVRGRLGEITVPVLELLGADDPVCPPERDDPVSDGVARGSLAVLHDVAHLPPVEAPSEVADLLLGHFGVDDLTALTPGATAAEVYAAGMAVRREVLGAAHVDRATAAAEGGPEAEFQRFITQYAWGGIWTRGGLDRRTRSVVTLTALLARGHDAELAMHVRAAITNGLTEREVFEVVLQCAVYLGVPDANHALRLVRQALAEPPD